jgi:N-acetylneuraminic acid mutarotase
MKCCLSVRVAFALPIVASLLPSTSFAAAWANSAALNGPRDNFTATLLSSGKVLLAGGRNNNGGFVALKSAELFDPATGLSSSTFPMAAPRVYFAASMLQDGRVLVVGGYDLTNLLASAEIYNPITGLWTNAGSLALARAEHTATLLPNGKILVVGGTTPLGTTATVELFDPGTGAWTSANPIPGERYEHTATALPNGNVLVAGGQDSLGGLSSSHIYNSSTGTWTPTTTPMGTPHASHTATVLPNGLVLVAAGFGATSISNRSELFNPANGSWTPTGSLNTSRRYHSASLLPNGTVLVAGGGAPGATTSAEIYNPNTGLWTATLPMGTARTYHTATMLPNGKLFVAGGNGSNGGSQATSETYDYSSPAWTFGANMISNRFGHTLTHLPNGKVLASGGLLVATNSVLTNTAELFDPATRTWTNTGNMSIFRTIHAATLLADGRVLVSCGAGAANNALASAELYDYNTGSWTNTGSVRSSRFSASTFLLRDGTALLFPAEAITATDLYDPVTGTWSPLGSLGKARGMPSTTLLPNGKLLVAGGLVSGSPGNVPDATTELFDPATGGWSPSGSMQKARYSHASALLPNGKVLVAGGVATNSTDATAELYDPNSGTWTSTGPLTQARYSAVPILLANGNVLLIGGETNNVGSNVAQNTVDFYNPISGTWTAFPPLQQARGNCRAILLPDGAVLVTGGRANNQVVTSVEIYDPSPGISNVWRPQITGLPASVNLGNSLTVSGTNFRGISGGSSGSGRDSSTDYPIVKLRNVGNHITAYLPCLSWTSNSFTSVPLTGFPTGPALVTVYAGGFNSLARIVVVNGAPPSDIVLRESQRLTNNTFRFTFTNTPNAVFTTRATTNLSLAPTNWAAIGSPGEISPGQFQFIDSQATTRTQRFYSIRSP